jgi:cellobiose dehydrogenase (acceptor)
MKLLLLGALFPLALNALTIPAEVQQAAATADWAAQEWDVVVVGAGAAGIIVADRLSEDGLKTLLLEQGGASYGIVGGQEKPSWLKKTSLSRVDVPGLCKWRSMPTYYRNA